MDLKVVPLADEIMDDLKKVNTLVFSKPYPPIHYSLLSKYGLPLSFLVYDGKEPVGEISTRIEDDCAGITVHSVSMGVIPEYRRKGISSYLIDATTQAILSNRPKITKVFLMVEQDNEVAFNIYKKLGFKIEGKIKTSHVMGKYVEDVRRQIAEKMKKKELEKSETE